MITVGLFDACFFSGDNSFGYGQEVKGFRSKHIKWKREYLPVTFYTDMQLEYVEDAPPGTINVAWLIEPPSNSDWHYQKAKEMQGAFDHILTHNVNFINECTKARYYPHGGLWVRPLEPERKTRKVSMILSAKRGLASYELRHEIATKFTTQIDLYGPEFSPLPTKSKALLPYMYSIVVEPIRERYYFSEKLIDCFALWTVPVYWGCPDLCTFFFEPNGVIEFNNIDNLAQILPALTRGNYYDRMVAIGQNERIARKFYCAEDWIYEHYKEIFSNAYPNP